MSRASPRLGPANAPTQMARWRMAMYALPAVPMAMLSIPIPLMIPAFFAKEFGLSLTVIGTLLFVARVFDFVIDPLLGRMSDMTRSRYGKRRPWMVAGAPLVMAGSALLFMPPENASGLYLVGTSMLIYLGASMLGLAYSAWGAEVVTTYHGRTKLAGFREFAAIVGVLLAAVIPAVTAYYGHGLDRFTMAIIGSAIIVLTPLCVFGALRGVKEPAKTVTVHAEVPLLKALAQLYVNIPFRILCVGFVFIQIGASVSSATLVFYISYYLQQPELIGPVLVVSFVSILLFVPVWIRISRIIGKHRSVAISLIIVALGSSFAIFMMRPGDGMYFLILMAILGASSAAYMTLPVGIMGDVIDYDTLLNRGQRGGMFFGVWAFAQQISPAIAVGATLPLLNWLGFDPTYANDEKAAEAVRYVFCFGPLPFFLTGALLLFGFPIDARKHDIIRRRLEARQARQVGNI